MRKHYLSLLFSFFVCTCLNAQSPYAYYPLEGNANDTTGNHFNGTIHGPLALGPNQYNQTDGAMVFAPTDSNYIVLPNIFDFPYRTVIAWFNTSQYGSTNNENVVYMADNSNIQYGLTNILVLDSSGSMRVSMSCDQFTTSQTGDTGIWYQCAVMRSPLWVKFFVNGMLIDSMADPNGGHSGNQSTFDAVIGADRGFNALFNGLIDDVEIYDTILSDQQVTGNYTAVTEVHQIDSALKTYAQSGNIYVQIPDACSNDIRSVALYDAGGKEITSKPSIQFNGRLNDGPLAAGTYIVAVYTNNAQKPASRKVVVTN